MSLNVLMHIWALALCAYAVTSIGLHAYAVGRWPESRYICQLLMALGLAWFASYQVAGALASVLLFLAGWLAYEVGGMVSLQLLPHLLDRLGKQHCRRTE